MSGTVARSLGALGDALGGTANVNFDAGTLFIDGTNNNVGIGTTSPGYALDILNSTAAVVRMAANTTSGYGFYQIGRSSTATNNWHMGSEGDGTFRFYNGNWGAGTERMRIDASGRITMPFQPAFHAFGGSVVSVSISNYILALGSTLTNRGSHYNTSTFRFTAPVAGMYMFAHRVTWGSNGSGVSVFQALNGSAFGGGTGVTEVFGYTSAGGYNTTSASVSFISLNANDFVDLRSSIYNSSAQSLDLSRCSFSGYLIG